MRFIENSRTEALCFFDRDNEKIDDIAKEQSVRDQATSDFRIRAHRIRQRVGVV
jgi:hypothetical protein